MADRKRILIADDDPDFVELLQLDLTQKGYEVRTTGNGKDTLQAALAEKFDLVLLDVMMPYIDGYHVACELSARLGARAPYIIIMTSRDAKREKGIALMSGAQEALQKPFELSYLHERVETALSRTPCP